MSDHDSDSGVTPNSKKGGSRTAGQRNEKNQARRTAAIKSTKEIWGVSEYQDIFPASIRPVGDLGDSAIINLRQIAGKVPQIAAARVLMTNECVDGNGRPVRLSFKHTNSILIHLKNVDAQTVEENTIKDDKKPKPKVQASSKAQVADGTPGLTAAKGDILSQRKPGLRLMADDGGLFAGLGTVKTSKSVKHGIDGGDEQPFKKLKFNKESIEAELKYVKRAIVQKDDHFVTEVPTPRAKMKVGKESKAMLSANRTAQKFIFSDGSGQKGEGQKEVLRDAAGSDGLLGSGSVNLPKQSEQARELVGLGISNRSSAEILATKEEKEKKRKTRGEILDSPASPKESISVRREEHINSTAGRHLLELHESKRIKIVSFSSPIISPQSILGNPYVTSAKKVSDLPAETSQEHSAMATRVMDREISEASGRGTSWADRREFETSFPLLPEVLIARIPEDRALILSIPGILRAYVERLRAAIPDGMAPDGDLLSMIIVNKYGYLLEHVDRLGEELRSVYYQTIDKDEQMERKENEREQDCET